ncbi:MAG: ABC transporter ATP-binding protein [bacterium]
MNALISAHNLGKNYGSYRALDSVSFDIKPGKIIGLIGPNGAGKTSLLKALLGLTTYQGELSVMGLDPRKNRAKMMEDVSFIADVAVLPRWIRVSELLEYVEGVHPKFNRDKALHFLELTKLGIHQKVREMSKGMVVQLHLALIMAIDSKLLVLDEPTLGLDILYRKSFYSALINDYFDEQKTIIITTHQVEEIEHILTDLMFIRNGKIILNTSMDTMHQRFSEVMIHPDQLEKAAALKPISERSVFGKHVFLFDGVSHEILEKLGEIHHPSVSDLFVATMQEKKQ